LKSDNHLLWPTPISSITLKFTVNQALAEQDLRIFFGLKVFPTADPMAVTVAAEVMLC
jgi:hypothetical protein